jgi:hypothetical protein
VRRCHLYQNNVNSSDWKSTLQRLGIVGLFLFVISYQLRSSIETIHLARNLNYWLPFSVEAFSDRMENISQGIVTADPIAKTVPFNRDGPFHLLAVNHRQFRGMSVYLTQLWNHHPTIGADPTFQISMRYGHSRPFLAWFLIPHCTCGTATLWQLIQLFLLPPVFCVLLAFLVTLRRPNALHVWALSALLLSISQLDLFWHRASFQWTANTMAWTDWFRVPATLYRAFVQNIWPAALVITASFLFPIAPVAQRWSRRIAMVLFAYCLIQAVLALAWSEYYLPFVPLYDWLQQHRTEMIAVTLTFIASVCFLHNRALGCVVFVIAILASSVPYWPAPRIGIGREIAVGLGSLADVSYRKFAPSISAPVVSSAAVVPAFAAATILCILALEFRRTKRLLSVSLLFLLPPVLYLLGVLNGNLTIGARWSYLVSVLICAGAGLLGLSVYCLLGPDDTVSREAAR